MSPLTLTPIVHIALFAYLYVRSGGGSAAGVEIGGGGGGGGVAHAGMPPSTLDGGEGGKGKSKGKDAGVIGEGGQGIIRADRDIGFHFFPEFRNHPFFFPEF